MGIAWLERRLVGSRAPFKAIFGVPSTRESENELSRLGQREMEIPKRVVYFASRIRSFAIKNDDRTYLSERSLHRHSSIRGLLMMSDKYNRKQGPGFPLRDEAS
jgi:hypothetical protein